MVHAGDDVAKSRKDLCEQILNRDRGFSWKEIELSVQNLMDFYCGDVRGEGLLRRGLERLEQTRNAPIRAENIHELARSLEVQSIIDNAELVLRSSIERKESRVSFDFRRSEFLDQDDANWLCFLAIQRDKNGSFTFRKLPVDK
jgi:succinate dehydrogenase/fumarate reductase flavoprotein subunit